MFSETLSSHFRPAKRPRREVNADRTFGTGAAPCTAPGRDAGAGRQQESLLATLGFALRRRRVAVRGSMRAQRGLGRMA